MNFGIHMRRKVIIVIILISSIGAHGQVLPGPLDAWNETDGSWTFDGTDDGIDYVWQYNSHTFPRRLAFGFEQIAAPQLARDNVVAWAYSLNHIDPNDISALRDDIEEARVAFALRHAQDSTYYVLPETLTDRIVNNASTDLQDWWNFDDLLTKASGEWSPWIVSLNSQAYKVDGSQVEWISNWNERPLPLTSESLPWMGEER